MTFGKAKALMDRQRGYLSAFNFIMISVLFFDKIKWHWYYLLLIPVWAIFMYFDTRYIMPKEFEYLHLKSPVMKELLKK